MKGIVLVVLSLIVFQQTAIGQQFHAGYSIYRNNYLESKMDNLSTKFNLGWEMDPSNPNYFIDFVPSGKIYEIQNKMSWNRIATGITLGVSSDPVNDVSFEFNFSGQTNSASGRRTNSASGEEEKFGLKTKFGGLNFIVGFNPNEIISFNIGMGAHIFKAKYSWESATTSIDNQTIGLRINPLSQEVKAGDRSLTLTFPVGVTVRLMKINAFALYSRVNYNIVWNDFLKTELLTYLPYRYNMNGVSCTLFLAYNLNP